MKKERYSFTEDSALKPLFANLRRVGIAEYISSETFDQLMVEFNMDGDWDACLDECEVGDEDKALDYEEPFFLLLNIIYEESVAEEATSRITLILTDFLKWSKTEVNLKDVLKCLKDLDLDQDKLSKFGRAAAKLNQSKNSLSEEPTKSAHRNPSKVFIVHGHDTIARLELEKLVRDEFGLTPVVLQDNPNDGLDTIISKFERLAKECSLAVVLFTPDDETSDSNFRSRQNVILELGYFLGRDQEKDSRKIIILKKGNVEIPSDISGVIYLAFNKSVEEVFLKFRQQLKHWKIIV